MGLLGIRPLGRILIDLTAMAVEDFCAYVRHAEDERWNIRGRTVWVVRYGRGHTEIFQYSEDAQRFIHEELGPDTYSATFPIEIQ